MRNYDDNVRVIVIAHARLSDLVYVADDARRIVNAGLDGGEPLGEPCAPVHIQTGFVFGASGVGFGSGHLRVVVQLICDEKRVLDRIVEHTNLDITDLSAFGDVCHAAHDVGDDDDDDDDDDEHDDSGDYDTHYLNRLNGMH